MPDALLFTQPAAADAAEARSSFSLFLVFTPECERRHELVADAILRFVVFDLSYKRYLADIAFSSSELLLSMDSGGIEYAKLLLLLFFSKETI